MKKQSVVETGRVVVSQDNPLEGYASIYEVVVEWTTNRRENLQVEQIPDEQRVQEMFCVSLLSYCFKEP